MNFSHKLQRLIAKLYLVLIFILPFVFCWISDELFEFNKMLVVYAFSLVISCLFLIRMILEKRLIWQKTIFDWPFALFLFSQIISTIFSLHPRTSLLGYYTRLNGGLLSTFAYLALFYTFVNNIDQRARRQFFASLFAGGALVSLYAIGEHFGRSFSCLIIKGNFDVSCWVQDVQTRVFATFGQPNWLAAYNVTLIGLGIGLLISHWLKFLSPDPKATSPKFSLTYFIIALSVYLNFIALIFTKSRSGIIAFFVSLAFIISALIIFWLRQKILTRRHFTTLGLILLGFLIPALIWGTQYTPSFQQFISTTFATNQLPPELPANLTHLDLRITDSADIRRIVWQGALKIWQTHPLIGTGVESFAYSYYNYRPTDHNWTSEWDFLYNKAHNEFLNFAANSGTLGLLTYLLIFFTLGFTTLKFIFFKKQSQTHHVYLLIGLNGGLLALSLTNFFGFSTVTVQVLLFLFLAISAQIFTPSPKIAVHALRFHTQWQNIALFFTVFFTFYLLNQVWLTWYADFNYARCKSSIGKVDINQALAYCQQAIKLRPKEATYYVDLADFYAQYAVTLAKRDPQSPHINDLANLSLKLSDQSMILNHVNLNFYKTRFRTLSNLGLLDSQALLMAQKNLEEALKLSPTDPKLTYYYATILGVNQQPDEALAWLEKTISLRPIYLEARLALAKAYHQRQNFSQALEHYHYIIDYINPNHGETYQLINNLATISGIISP